MGKVIPLPQPDARPTRPETSTYNVPRPLSDVPESELLYVLIDDDSFAPAGLPAGCIARVHVGVVSDFGPHAVETPDDGLLIRIINHCRPGMICLSTPHAEIDPLCYPEGNLMIVGRVIDMMHPAIRRRWAYLDGDSYDAAISLPRSIPVLKRRAT